MAETCTVVVDVGSSSVKAGYVGDDIPCAIFPSLLQKHPHGVECIEATDGDLSGASAEFGVASVAHPVVRGEVKDWDTMEKLWTRMLDTIGVNSPDSASIMLTESPRSTVAERMKWGELLFETFRSPSICIGNSASLSLFASGRTTGMVVECGAGLTSVVPVFEGLSLSHAAICMDYGGQDITCGLRKILSDIGVPIDFNDARVLKEKMAEAYVPSKDIVYSGASSSSATMKRFELPDGTEVNVDKKIFTDCTEPLFRNTKIGFPNGLINQSYEALRLCDDSIRRDLAHNIVVAGGTSLLPGISDRLSVELQQRMMGEQRAKGTLHDINVRVIPNSTYRYVSFFFHPSLNMWMLYYPLEYIYYMLLLLPPFLSLRNWSHIVFSLLFFFLICFVFASSFS